MMSTVEHPVMPREAAPDAAEALLIHQLASATRELRAREAEGRRTDEVRTVVRSLRKTLGWIAERGNGADPCKTDFAMKGTPGGGIELWHQGARVPVESEQLREALERAGVTLGPDQVLLADRDLARRITEESLVAVSLREFRLRETKAALMRTVLELRSPGSDFPAPERSE